MKKLILFLLLIPLAGMSQKEEKVDQYCKLIAQPGLLSRKVNIDVDYGDERKLFKDTG